MNKMIYADNAATTRLSDAALQAMLPYMQSEYGNASQPYSFARAPKAALAKARETVAKCIGALPEEIYFTSGGTESNNWVLRNNILSGSEVLVSDIEHHSVLNAAKEAEILDHYLPVDDEGIVSPTTLTNAISDRTALVSVMMANNEIGTIEPIAELAAIAHKHNCLFHTDAVQAVGHIDINVHELDVDFLSASAHKFNGPKGVGFLYIRKGITLDPLILGGAQESNMRAGTENIASIVAMAAALEENVIHLQENKKHLRQLEECFFAQLAGEGIRCHRNGALSSIPGNISVSFDGLSGEAILHRLDLKGIMISTGSACDSKDTQISHVLKAINLSESLAKGTIRISFGKYNTQEDAIAIAKALVQIIKAK